VKVLDRQTALKHWIAAEIRWYRNVVSRGSAVLRDALLPISEINSCALSVKTPRVSTIIIISCVKWLKRTRCYSYMLSMDSD